MGRPVIGIVGNLLVEQGGFSPGMERSYVNNDYVAAVERAGGIPLILPVVRGQDVAERQTECADALLISGGYDIDPLLYGVEPHRALEFVYRDTDIFQLRTIKTALAKGQPLLAICKGIQLLNVACGGTIYQDLDEIPDSFVKHSQNRKRSCPSHTVVAEEGSVIAELLGTSFPVNSYHHQAVKDVDGAEGHVPGHGRRGGIPRDGGGVLRGRGPVAPGDDDVRRGRYASPVPPSRGGGGKVRGEAMTVKADVVLSPGETLPDADSWLVIDILRATTTMCAFFDGGGKFSIRARPWRMPFCCGTGWRRKAVILS